jgi:two-component system, cell cycle response regulator DivK
MSKKVLIVEDYKDSREFMMILIKAYGHEVLTAKNGREAVEIAMREIPDLILMDIALPVMDGIEATEIIKNSAETSKIPVIAITSHGDTLGERAIKAGCDKVITKPLDYSKFEPIINEYLEK